MAAKRELSPVALSLADLAKLLTAAGGQTITVEMIKRDLEAGAPTNQGGTLNLMHYLAWLIRSDKS